MESRYLSFVNIDKGIIVDKSLQQMKVVVFNGTPFKYSVTTLVDVTSLNLKCEGLGIDENMTYNTELGRWECEIDTTSFKSGNYFFVLTANYNETDYYLYTASLTIEDAQINIDPSDIKSILIEEGEGIKVIKNDDGVYTISNSTIADEGIEIIKENNIYKIKNKRIGVVDAYRDGFSWYRVYSDGWVEQGGRTSLNENSSKTVALHKEMIDTNYCVLVTNNCKHTSSNTEGALTATISSKTQIQVHAGYIDPNTTNVFWEVKGYIKKEV